MANGETLCFGPHVLDTDTRRLTRDGVEVRIASREMDVLIVLTRHPGQLFSKDKLIESAWDDVEVTTGSLDQAIYRLRKTLTQPGDPPFIETQPRRGYRFIAAVSRVEPALSDEALEAALETNRAWVEGRAALETLDCHAIARARALFEKVLARAPGHVTAHIGLANACALQFEMTRTDAAPDTAALETAHYHAREGCRRAPQNGEAWSILGFVLERIGERDNALAAARQAIELEPGNCRHQLRLSAVSWGEERLTAARRALRQARGLPMAHWFAATVLIARESLDEAERELAAGVSSPDGERHRYSFVGLHWLLGLVALARGDSARALELFQREFEHEQSGHLYAKECAANSWYAIGATRRRQGDHDGARANFEECLRRVARHPMARAALGMPPISSNGHSPVDTAIAEAVACAVRDDGNASNCGVIKIERALAQAAVGAVGSAGWLLPIEPMLNVSARPEAWVRALARLRSGAV